METQEVNNTSDQLFILGQLRAFQINTEMRVFESTDAFNEYVDTILDKKGVKKIKSNRTKEIKNIKGTIFSHNGKPFAYLVL